MDGNIWPVSRYSKGGLRELTVLIRLNFDLVLELMIKRSLFGFGETRNGQVTTMFPSSVRQPRTSWPNLRIFRSKSASCTTEPRNKRRLMTRSVLLCKGYRLSWGLLQNRKRSPPTRLPSSTPIDPLSIFGECCWDVESWKLYWYWLSYSPFPKRRGGRTRDLPWTGKSLDFFHARDFHVSSS
jgi:hypothetical protein